MTLSGCWSRARVVEKDLGQLQRSVVLFCRHPRSSSTCTLAIDRTRSLWNLCHPHWRHQASTKSTTNPRQSWHIHVCCPAATTTVLSIMLPFRRCVTVPTLKRHSHSGFYTRLEDEGQEATQKRPASRAITGSSPRSICT